MKPDLAPVPYYDRFLGPTFRGFRKALVDPLSGLDSGTPPWIFSKRAAAFFGQLVIEEGDRYRPIISTYENIRDAGTVLDALKFLSGRIDLREQSAQHGSAASVGVCIRMYADAFAHVDDDEPFRGPQRDAPYRGLHVLRVHGLDGDFVLFTHNWDGWEKSRRLSVEYLSEQMTEAFVDVSGLRPPEGAELFADCSFGEVAEPEIIPHNTGYAFFDQNPKFDVLIRRVLSINRRDRLIQVILTVKNGYEGDWPSADDRSWIGKRIVVGWAYFRLTDAQTVTLEELFVHPRHRGQHLASAMIYTSMFNFHILGIRHVSVSVREGDEHVARYAADPPATPRWLNKLGSASHGLAPLDLIQMMASRRGQST